MKLTLRRYKCVLILQFTLLLADLFLNTFARMLFAPKLQIFILLFILQDVFIIFEYLLFTFVVHCTCVYEVGATYLVLRNCKLFLLSIVLYFLLSCGQHCWIIYDSIFYPDTISFPLALRAIAFIQRMTSVCYYYSCKRTALILSDPRYYAEHIDWITAQLDKK